MGSETGLMVELGEAFTADKRGQRKQSHFADKDSTD